MPGEKGDMLLCYNRGCGQMFDAKENKDDSCVFHPGAPFFHDAYKGWSCCKKKCTDFTEFLNIKGCTKSFHSNVKPVEPEKPKVDKNIEKSEVIEYRAPESRTPIALERPSFDIPLVTLKPEVSPTLRQQVAALVKSTDSSEDSVSDENIAIGTNCKNNSCKQTYEGTPSLTSPCVYHPGVPVFHEGLKYWSCCVKRTTDFNAFLEQAGCASGTHVWHKSKAAGTEDNKVQCRLDWHQTPSHVYVSVFAKKYDPDSSVIQLAPIRLKFTLFFPEGNGTYSKDLELRGIVDVAQSSVSMMPTKAEIKLRKLEPGSWSNLDFPQVQQADEKTKSSTPHSSKDNETNLVSKVDAVDLSDL
ncbi:cysteine and histidine rich domain containing protein isoform X2 [Lycorma delicatula]|uniref:cysteine and histidine rich domain containing protein isoform X2 n=1 Tax=Lycorma delicatula TaxID=130591 RepID=UPI003F512ACE